MNENSTIIAAILAFLTPIIKIIIDTIAQYYSKGIVEKISSKVELYDKIVKNIDDDEIKNKLKDSIHNDIDKLLIPLKNNKMNYVKNYNIFLYLFMISLIIVIFTNTITMIYPQLSPRYIALSASIACSSAYLYKISEKKKYVLIYLIPVSILIFIMAFGIANFLADATSGHPVKNNN